MSDWCKLPAHIASKIEIVTESGCWIWTACTHKSGYGKTCINKRLMYAHRAVYELIVGPIPGGLTLDHLCRVRCCVNPAHLEPVTIAENISRGESASSVNSKKTHCPRGHLLQGVNLRDLNRKARECVVCHSARTKNWSQVNPRGYDKEYYMANRERIRKYQNAYSAKKRRSVK